MKEQEMEEFTPYENEDNELVMSLLRSIILAKLEKKLKSISVESASTEENYCQVLGFVEGLKYAIETVKNS